jgi:hypothetical protein
MRKGKKILLRVRDCKGYINNTAYILARDGDVGIDKYPPGCFIVHPLLHSKSFKPIGIDYASDHSSVGFNHTFKQDLV